MEKVLEKKIKIYEMYDVCKSSKLLQKPEGQVIIKTFATPVNFKSFKDASIYFSI